MKPEQRAVISAQFDRFVAGCRQYARVDDRELAEWLLSLGARWLHAHGYSRPNIQLWIAQQLEQGGPVPLAAAAAARKDFGERR